MMLASSRQPRPTSSANAIDNLGQIRAEGSPAGAACSKLSGMNRSVPARIAAAPRVPVTRFVGRHAEMAAIREHIRRGSRLVTIWGSAGMGKTRLATEAAISLRPSFPRGVVFCALADARDGPLLRRTVARSIDLDWAAPAADEVLALHIGEALARRGPLLVVLDNLEHVLAEATAAIDLWTQAAPEVVWIATSRQRTRLAVEVAIELTPLAVSGPGVPEAVELFLDRIGRTDDGRIDATLVDAVAPLVAKVDGIPLAIELAAARFDLLNLDKTLLWLERSLDLQAPGRGRSARQATLRGALEWSWDLLEPAEQRALARMAVFRGGFTAEAAAALLAGLGGAPLDRVEALRDRSLLRFEAKPTGLRPSRITLFEGVRELADEKLSSSVGEREAGESLHAQYFLSLGEKALALFEDTGANSAVDAIADELDNLLAVVDRAFGRRDATLALRSVLVVDVAVMTRGPFGSHLERLERALGIDRSALPPELLARGLTALGRARGIVGRPVEASEALEEALRIARQASDRRVETAALIELGIICQRTTKLDRARALYRRALTIAGAEDAPRAAARIRGNLGAVEHDARDLDAAIEQYERALAILALAPPSARDLRLSGIFSTNLGLLEQERGSVGEAERRYTQAIESLEASGDRRLLAIALGSLGSLHHEEGRLEGARASHERALGLLRETGDRRSEALGCARLGAALASLGLSDDARWALERGERLSSLQADPLVIAAIEVSRSFLDLAAAHRARGEGRARGANTSVAAARKRIARARSGAPSAADRSDDVRVLLRLLERTLAAFARRPNPRDQAHTLLISPAARWVRPPAGTWQDFRQREPARRLLLKLVAEHRARPGEGVSIEALREAGWPGEKIGRAAARNRIYVALSQLRKLGLQSLLRRADDGYSLDPKVPIHVVTLDPDTADRPLPPSGSK